MRESLKEPDQNSRDLVEVVDGEVEEAVLMIAVEDAEELIEAVEAVEDVGAGEVGSLFHIPRHCVRNCIREALDELC
jgi:hypothetical protein